MLSAPGVCGRPDEIESAEEEVRSPILRLNGKRRKTLLGRRGDWEDAEAWGEGSYGDCEADAEAS